MCCADCSEQLTQLASEIGTVLAMKPTPTRPRPLAKTRGVCSECGADVDLSTLTHAAPVCLAWRECQAAGLDRELVAGSVFT